MSTSNGRAEPIRAVPRGATALTPVIGASLAAGCAGTSGAGASGQTPLEMLATAVLALALAIVIAALIYRRRKKGGVGQGPNVHGPRGDEIFRFLDIRPPPVLQTTGSAIETRARGTYMRRQEASDLAGKLRRARDPAERSRMLVDFSKSWPSGRAAKVGQKLAALLAAAPGALEAVRRDKDIATLEQLERALVEPLGAASAKDYVADEAFAQVSALVWDAHLGQRIERRRELPALANLREASRVVVLLRLLANGRGLESNRDSIVRAVNASILMPSITPSVDEIEEGVVGSVNVLGVGDLRLVRQNVICYEPGEIAHVENVMGRERRERTHTRTRRFEETALEESETSRETERDLKSEERFEMQKETQRTSSMDFSLAVGVNVTATYGFVTVNGSTNLGVNTSETTSQTIASSYAKDVVDRSVTRIQERVRNLRETRSFDEIIEANLHGFDNTSSANHVIGVYRWLDKIYEMRLVNYGRRLMIEVQVPEPAAFLRFATRSEKERALDKIEAPTAPHSEDPRAIEGQVPLVSADGITETNYLLWAAEYGAESVRPPPARRSIVASLKTDEPGSGGGVRVQLEQGLVIPEGYRALRFRHRRLVVVNAREPDRSEYRLQLLVGGEKLMLNPSPDYLWGVEGGNLEFDFSTDLQAWTVFTDTGAIAGTIPVSVIGILHQRFTLHVEVEIEPTADSKKQWQITTYDAVVAAYEEKLSAVEDQRRRLEASQEASVRMRSPAANRAIVERELKRGALAMITENRLGSSRHFVSEATGEIADVDAAAEHGRFAQFFEQAFEWNAMTFALYPYFWAHARSSEEPPGPSAQNWAMLLASEHDDALMQPFLQAGYARCVLPVRPGYEMLAVDYLYFHPADPWGVDGPPTLGDGSEDPRYVSIAEELAAPPQEEIEATWQVRVPTELVMLQQDATLPCHADPPGVRP